MPTLDLSQFVTQAALDRQLQPLAEIRTMLRDDLRGLHEGQDRLATQIAEMNSSICARMDEANHRTNTLEATVDTIEAEAREARDTAKTVLNDGCHQKANHVIAMTTLARVGALEDLNDAALAEREDLESQTFLKRHGRKAAVAGGLGLGGFGLGLLAPHVGQILDWLIHLFFKVPQ